jgi:hypothetical protein
MFHPLFAFWAFSIAVIELDKSTISMTHLGNGEANKVGLI